MNRLDEITARKAEIKELLNSNESVNLEEVRAEIDALEAEERSINLALADEAKEAEERRATAEQIEAGAIVTTEIREVKDVENIEMRNTAEYGKAFVKAFVKGDDKDLRSLLSTNVEGGYVPVPEVLENEIKNAWETSRFMEFAKITNYKGNVKVGFEVSASDAVVHVEGTDAVTEEALIWGVVELKAENIKKFITISDEAIENTTLDTLGEIYKEVAHKIVAKAEALAIAKIVASPAVSSATAPAVPALTASTLAEDTIINAEGLLSGQATDIVAIMNRQTYSALKGVMAKAKYNVDVFDGIARDHILFTEALKPFSSATSGETYAIVGDLGYGFQFNRPNGAEMVMKTDDLSLAEKDLVKVIGRMFVGMGVVAPNALVKIVK